MYSLFTRIFLSFWLLALLLLASMIALDRHLGEDSIEQAVDRVDAHAQTVSALLQDEGLPAVRRWLFGMARSEQMPMLLLDAEGRPLADLAPPRRMHERWNEEFSPGVRHLRPGLVRIVRPVPGTEPPLQLAAVVHLDQAHYLPLWGRIALALLVSGLVCLGLAALITRPVRRLRRAAQALADGDLSVRVQAGGRDEVGALARDFNLMADRVRDLLESHRRLLRDVSHELRSPLARLRVALELARNNGDTAALVARTERETERLENLVSDVLSLARLEAGQTRLNRQPLPLQELLRAIAQDADFEARAAGKRVELQLQANPVVEGDPVLLRAAVENVMRNGVRHSPEGAAVTLALRVEGREAVIAIRDRGAGVPEQELGELFKPFTRVGEARDRNSGGFGLGLAISRQAVEAHGGAVAAANAPDGGLCVTLRLPVTAPG